MAKEQDAPRLLLAAESEERRAIREPLDFRESGKAATISGYAAVFNKETVIGGFFGGFREVIAPGAFDDALARPDDVRALFNHDPNMLLGRTASETLRLSIDKKGLRYEVDLPDTAAARDVRELIKRGDVSGSSFAFRVDDDEWDESDVKKGKLPLRTLTKLELFDVSPVTYPAYPQTSVSARSKAKTIAQNVAANNVLVTIDGRTAGGLWRFDEDGDSYSATLELDKAREVMERAKQLLGMKRREAARAAIDQAKAWR